MADQDTPPLVLLPESTRRAALTWAVVAALLGVLLAARAVTA